MIKLACQFRSWWYHFSSQRRRHKRWLKSFKTRIKERSSAGYNDVVIANKESEDFIIAWAKKKGFSIVKNKGWTLVCW